MAVDAVECARAVLDWAEKEAASANASMRGAVEGMAPEAAKVLINMTAIRGTVNVAAAQLLLQRAEHAALTTHPR